MAFGVVLFTLLFQGLTMRPLIRRMGLLKRRENQDEYERRHARSVMSKAAYEQIATMQHHGLLSEHVWESLEPALANHATNTAKAVRDIMHDNPEVEIEEYDTRIIDISFYLCQLNPIMQQVNELDVADHRWVRQEELSRFNFPKADLNLIKKLSTLELNLQDS